MGISVGVSAVRAWLATALAAGLLVGAGQAMAPRAAAAGGACPTPAGVTVVVDFTSLGGGVSVACAPGAPASGLDALARAGFAVVPAQNFPGAVCRISGLPDADAQACVDMPPGNAYWSYWHASRGGSWSYSQTGPGSSRPAPGSVEGWSFAVDGQRRPPSVAPPAGPQATPGPTPRPTPVATPRSTPTGAPSSGATLVPGATPEPTAGVATSPPTAEATGGDPPSPSSPMSDAPPPGSPTSPQPSAAASAAPVASPSDGTAGDPPGAAPGGDDPGPPPAGTVVGIGLLAAVLAGGMLVAQRDRGRPS